METREERERREERQGFFFKNCPLSNDIATWIIPLFQRGTVVAKEP
jgi:hypothetical protein